MKRHARKGKAEPPFNLKPISLIRRGRDTKSVRKTRMKVSATFRALGICANVVGCLGLYMLYYACGLLSISADPCSWNATIKPVVDARGHKNIYELKKKKR